jgi:hypothetical protein
MDDLGTPTPPVSDENWLSTWNPHDLPEDVSCKHAFDILFYCFTPFNQVRSFPFLSTAWMLLLSPAVGVAVDDAAQSPSCIGARCYCTSHTRTRGGDDRTKGGGGVCGHSFADAATVAVDVAATARTRCAVSLLPLLEIGTRRTRDDDNGRRPKRWR